MTPRWHLSLAPGFTALALLGCSGKPVGTDTGSPCADPVASAGTDITATIGQSVALDGTASTSCEARAVQTTWDWAFVAVPAGSALDDSALSDNHTGTASSPWFTPDVTGDYVLSLVVNDGQEQSPADFVVINVVSGDGPPVADCGADITGRVGQASEFDGSSSNDPEGARLEYNWALSSTPACSALATADLHNASGPTPTIVPDCDGIFTVSLVVSDGIHYSDPDICYVNVASGNRSPEADAGDTLELGGCADNPMQLNAWGSYDLDGDTLSYEWSLLTAPSGSAVSEASFDDVTSAAPHFSWDVPGTYTFQLQVFDGTVWSSPDVVSISIDEPENNRRPLANAGADQEISQEADCTSASYAWSCEDCQAATVELDGSASVDPDGDTLSYTWTEDTATILFSSRFSPITRATVPAQAATYGGTSSMSFEVQLEVEDCAESETDTVTINYTCEGVAE